MKTAMSVQRLSGTRMPEKALKAIETINDLIKPLEDGPPRKPIVANVKKRLQFQNNVSMSLSTTAFEQVRKSIKDNMMSDYSLRQSQNVLNPFEDAPINEGMMNRAVNSRVEQLNKRTTQYRPSGNATSLRQMPKSSHSPIKDITRFRMQNYRVGSSQILPAEPAMKTAPDQFVKAKIQNSIDRSLMTRASQANSLR